MSALILRVSSYILSGIGIGQIMNFFDDSESSEPSDYMSSIIKAISYLFVLVVGGFGLLWYFKKSK